MNNQAIASVCSAETTEVNGDHLVDLHIKYVGPGDGNFRP